MNSRELLNALSVAERLKDTTRHCYTDRKSTRLNSSH